jgi:hypothetical protein
MSALTQPTPVWSSMPGWGIAADLTPRELVDSRQLKALQKRIATALALVFVLCVAGYGLAVVQHSSASRAVDREAVRTSAFQRDTLKYSGITQIKGDVAQVQATLATLMKGDVDLTNLLTSLRSSLPNSMAIRQLNITFVAAGAVSGGAGAASSGIDSTHTRIGTVSMSGSGRNLVDLSAYVDRLSTIKGVVNVLPTANSATTTGTQFSLTFDLTDQLYSHRFDGTTTGG